MSSYRQKCTMLRRVVLQFRFVVLAHNYSNFQKYRSSLNYLEKVV